MQLFDYLEYMTNAERNKAAKNGQTNLNNVKVDTSKENDVSFIRQRNEMRENAQDMGIRVNEFRRFVSERIVILLDGTFGTVDANEGVHDDIIEYFYYEGKLPKNLPVGPMSKWNKEDKYFKHFICIHYDHKINNKTGNKNDVYFSESYLPETIASISSLLLDKYEKICKEKLGLNLKRMSYLKAQDEYLGVKYA